jgi:hypothetical protein
VLVASSPLTLLTGPLTLTSVRGRRLALIPEDAAHLTLSPICRLFIICSLYYNEVAGATVSTDRVPPGAMQFGTI